MQINHLIVVNCRGREFSDPSFTGNDWGLFSGRKKNSYQSLDEKIIIFAVFWVNCINISCSMRRKYITSFMIQTFRKINSDQRCILWSVFSKIGQEPQDWILESWLWTTNGFRAQILWECSDCWVIWPLKISPGPIIIRICGNWVAWKLSEKQNKRVFKLKYLRLNLIAKILNRTWHNLSVLAKSQKFCFAASE